MQTIRIDLKDTVFEIMRKWPPTVQVFLEHKMGCVGCSMAAFDSLADSLGVYQLPAGPFVDALLAAIQQENNPPTEETR